jgi:hypothetical protein
LQVIAGAAVAGTAAGRRAASAAAGPGGVGEVPAGRWVGLPAPPGSPRVGGDLRWSYDSTAGVMVMFGGDNVCGSMSYCRTTWTYDPGVNRWELRIPDDAPRGFPAGR